MSDPIQDELSFIWPGWNSCYERHLDHGVCAIVSMVDTTDYTCVPELYIGSERVWRGDERVSLRDAARALRRRAEFLGVALESVQHMHRYDVCAVRIEAGG